MKRYGILRKKQIGGGLLFDKRPYLILLVLSVLIIFGSAVLLCVKKLIVKDMLDGGE
ncbi:MAG: hypothetical protein U0N91_02550 [Oscillospiraceae bacterium]